MLSDPIANMLTSIRNGYLAGKTSVKMPYSSMKKAVAEVLLTKGYLGKVSQETVKIKKKDMKQLILGLRYKNEEPVIRKIIKISKPGLRVYVQKTKIPRVLNGLGIVVISTSKGILEGQEAKKKGLGGELICKVW
jgi:small subunit ribosomal protein S8